MADWIDKLQGKDKPALPRYQCHKLVCAVKIGMFYDRDEGGAMIKPDCDHPESAAVAPFHVSDAYIERHRPQAGGYWVVYDDGYQSYSPAKSFEDGYRLAGAITDEQRLEWLRLNLESQEFGEVVSMTQPNDVAAFRQVIDDLMQSS